MILSPIVIRAKSLIKRYKLYSNNFERLKEALHPSRKKYHREYVALNSISFEIRKGQAVAIIGKNGSGKSTLLKILAGVLSPSSGEISVDGRVSALLELGAGFNPELTGIENIFLNGTLFGYTDEQIRRKLSSIVDFADIGDFINQPVKLYSSGMFVRLAFAVAINVDPEIIIVDEALAVGDVLFQQKCIRFLKKFRDDGGTIIFVTHDMPTVLSFCDRAILISPNMDTLIDGSPSEVCKRFLEMMYENRLGQEILVDSPVSDSSFVCDSQINSDETSPVQYVFSPFSNGKNSFGFGGMEIVDCYFESDAGKRISHAKSGSFINLCLRVNVKKSVSHAAFGMMIKDRTGQFIIAEGTESVLKSKGVNLVTGQIVLVRFSFKMPTLIDGEYLVNIAAAEGRGHDHVQHHWVHDAITIKALSSRLVQGIFGFDDLKVLVEIKGSSEKS